MRRLILAVACLVAMGVSMVSGQDWATSEGSCYKKGDINIGLGIPLYPFGVYAEGDYGFHDAISGGLGVGFVTSSHSVAHSYNEIPVLARASFHPFNLAVLSTKIPANIRATLDPYVGLYVGWRFGWASWNSGYGNLPGSALPLIGGFDLREHIGVRWYPMTNFYLFAEEGMGFGWMNIGAGLKF